MESENLIKQSLCKTVVLLLCAVSFCQVSYTQGTQDSRTAQAQLQPSPTPVDAQATATPNLSERTADGLKWFFTVLVYPAVVGGVFVLLVFCIIYIIVQGQGGYVRRTTGAVLPFLFLMFMLRVTDKADDPVKSFFLNRNPFIYVVVGTVLGIALVELGKRLIRTDDHRWGSIYNLFLSFMFVFLLYSIMKGFLDSLVYFLFSMIMSGGLDIVFFGQPESETRRERIVFMEAKGGRANSTLATERVVAPRYSQKTDRAEPDFESKRDPPPKDQP
ncbi:MAG TPA: hypothetical protein VNG71_20965 [Pyrinomonadaceae bacterium]|nr:hypothetical protein [Pyrinomonadaceae bacterium]